MEAFFRGSHTTNFVTCGFNKSYNQAAEVPSSNVTCKSPRSPSINCRIMLAFVSMTHSITIFPAPFLTAIEMLSLCTSIPIYFLLSIEGAPFCSGFEPNTQNPTPKGAPFYIASVNANGFQWYRILVPAGTASCGVVDARARDCGDIADDLVRLTSSCVRPLFCV